VTPLNWRAKPEEVEYCVTDAGAKAVAFDAPSATAVAGAPACAKLPRIAVGDVPAGANAFDALLDAPAHTPECAAGAEDWSLMLYTSGTTGKPKGVPRRHRTERTAALAHVAQNAYLSGERTLGVMPLYHTMGVRSLLAMAMIDGCFVCLPRFDAGAALRVNAAERVTNLYLVPTRDHDLLAHPVFAAADVGSVTKLGYAGAPMHDALLARLVKAFRPQLFVNHYGSSEIYTFTIDQQAAAKPGSAGRAGINARVRVVTLDAKTPQDLAPTRSEGQIIADLAGDVAFEGYWKRPDADARALREGWYFTGDTGYIDADGDLFVTGRVDDMIISGGENISPVDIESVLSLHPAVDDIAVAGLKDERWGQRVVAFVKRRAPVDAGTLDAHCKASDLPDFKRPREYVFVAEIPRSPVGKILRRMLVAGDYTRDPGAPQ
jgi:2-furoate---CoA ligase